jgi:Sec-independent protein translocase protein TatA
MAFGSELVLFLGAGFVVLGPKRMQTMLGQLGRAKAKFREASRSLMSEVTGGLDEGHRAATSSEDDDRDDTKLVLPDELIERLCNHSGAQR